MAKIAIDVVLVLPKAVINFAIQKNKELLNDIDDITILNKETCVPHISLCMGAVEESELEKVNDILRGLTQNMGPLSLSGTKVETETLSNGEKATGLKIENTPELQQLHESVMKELWPYLSYDLENKMFFSPPKVDEITLELTKSYIQKYKNPNLFNPHITLGIGELREQEIDLSFQATELAIFQLGNYCTCRKKLYSINF